MTSKVDLIWNRMNESERFGCQFGLFPYWVHEEFQPTKEEIIELMKKPKLNVND